MSILKIGFIGAGKVGFSLGKLFADGNAAVTGYYSRRYSSALEAARFTDTKPYERLESITADSDALFLTVPDQEIRSVYGELVRLGIKGKTVCQCSGALTVDETFPNIKGQGAQGQSVHPLFPVNDKYTSYRGLTGAFFCIEENDGCELWWELLEGMGLKTRYIAPAVKPKYHAACAVVSNLACALADIGTRLMEQCGFSQREALDALAPLIKHNTENIIENGAAAALTGPTERGDAVTVKKHLDCLTGSDKELYRSASLILAKLAEEKSPDRDRRAVTALLNEGGMSK